MATIKWLVNNNGIHKVIQTIGLNPHVCPIGGVKLKTQWQKITYHHDERRNSFSHPYST